MSGTLVFPATRQPAGSGFESGAADNKEGHQEGKEAEKRGESADGARRDGSTGQHRERARGGRLTPSRSARSEGQTRSFGRCSLARTRGLSLAEARSGPREADRTQARAHSGESA
jgi:hypothetical protein